MNHDVAFIQIAVEVPPVRLLAGFLAGLLGWVLTVTESGSNSKPAGIYEPDTPIRLVATCPRGPYYLTIPSEPFDTRNRSSAT